MKPIEKVGKLFSTNGEDVWECIAYCEYPSLTFRNLRTGKDTGGAVGSDHVNSFKPLKMEEEEQ